MSSRWNERVAPSPAGRDVPSVVLDAYGTSRYGARCSNQQDFVFLEDVAYLTCGPPFALSSPTADVQPNEGGCQGDEQDYSSGHLPHSCSVSVQRLNPASMGLTASGEAL